MKGKLALKRIAVSYAMAVIFTIASYGLLGLAYGRMSVSFFEWVLILLTAFTIAYIPMFFRLFRRKSL